MKEFITKLNPVMSIIKFLVILGFMFLTGFLIYAIAKGKISNDNSMALPMLGFMVMYSFIAYTAYNMFNDLMAISVYKFTDTHVEIRNLISGKKQIWDKKDVKGYSTSYVPHKNWDAPCIILYLNTKSMEMIRYDFRNFNKIKPALEEFGYNYLGEEPYVSKGLYGREYQFEER